MDKTEKLLRIKSLLTEKKVQEDVFSLKVNKLNEEIYAKQMNPLLINFLNFTSSSAEKLENAIKKAGGKFKERHDYHFTREQYENGYKLLESKTTTTTTKNKKIEEFFEIFDAVYIEDSDKANYYDFLDLIEEVVKDFEFARKHSYVGGNLEQISFRKYLKVVYDNRIELLKTPLEHLEYMKVHGIWEVVKTDSPLLDEPSYLLAHCTRTHTSCWPIISEGLKISKSNVGRCGKGIYFSNDISKCLQYTTFNNLGQKLSFTLIFFAQVYMGKIRKITNDNTSLTRSNDYDSVLAMGQVSPKIDVDIRHSDGTSSKIFIDSPTKNTIQSSFYNNEFVIYDEKRARLRYIILISHSLLSI